MQALNRKSIRAQVRRLLQDGWTPDEVVEHYAMLGPTNGFMPKSAEPVEHANFDEGKVKRDHGQFASKPGGKADKKPAGKKPAPKPAQDVYLLKSKLGGVVPKIGGLHHEDVAFVPRGESPVTPHGTSSPSAEVFGTRRGHDTFLKQGTRHDVEAEKVDADPAEVRKRIAAHKEDWHALHQNCQHAARKALGIAREPEFNARKVAVAGVMVGAGAAALAGIALKAGPHVVAALMKGINKKAKQGREDMFAGGFTSPVPPVKSQADGGVVTFGADGRMVVYSEQDWTLSKKGKRGGNIWVNVNTGREVHQHDNPGKGQPHESAMSDPNYDPETAEPPALTGAAAKAMQWAKQQKAGGGQGDLPEPPAPQFGKSMSDEEYKSALAQQQKREEWETQQKGNKGKPQPKPKGKPRKEPDRDKIAEQQMLDDPKRQERLKQMAMGQARAEGRLPSMDPAQLSQERLHARLQQHVSREPEMQKMRAQLQAIDLRTPEGQAQFKQLAPQAAQQAAQETHDDIADALLGQLDDVAMKKLGEFAKPHADLVAKKFADAGGNISSAILGRLGIGQPGKDRALEMARKRFFSSPAGEQMKMMAEHASKSLGKEAAHSTLTGLSASAAEAATDAASEEAVKAALPAAGEGAATVAKNALLKATAAITGALGTVGGAASTAGAAVVASPLFVPAIVAAGVAASAYAAYHSGKAAYTAATQAGHRYAADAARKAIARDHRAITNDAIQHGKAVAMAMSGAKAGVTDYFKNFSAPGLIGQAFGAW